MERIAHDVLRIINSVFARSEINITNKDTPCITEKDITTDITLLGIDSIVFIMIIIALEEEYKCEFPDSKLIISKMNTISKIIEELNALI